MLGIRIRKAWLCLAPGYENWSEEACIVHAPTAGKARYKCFKDFQDAWDDIAGSDLLKVRVRRLSESDIELPMACPSIGELTKQQIHIIKHTYGVDSREPGHRNYYYCSLKKKELLGLVKIGLMHPGEQRWTKGSGYFSLNDRGIEVARSMIPTYLR